MTYDRFICALCNYYVVAISFYLDCCLFFRWHVCCGVDGAGVGVLLLVVQLVQFRSSLEESLGVGGTS